MGNALAGVHIDAQRTQLGHRNAKGALDSAQSRTAHVSVGFVHPLKKIPPERVFIIALPSLGFTNELLHDAEVSNATEKLRKFPEFLLPGHLLQVRLLEQLGVVSLSWLRPSEKALAVLLNQLLTHDWCAVSALPE